MTDVPEALGAAIEQVISHTERGITAKWVVLVESLDANGDRGLWAVAAPDMKVWDTLGLLQYGMARETARVTNPEEKP